MAVIAHYFVLRVFACILIQVFKLAQWIVESMRVRRIFKRGVFSRANSSMPRQAWKSRWAGGEGDSDTFFFFSDNFLRHLHYWVGVPSVYQTDLRGDKQKKRKKKTWHSQRGGGGGAGGGLNPQPPPPPLRTRLVESIKLVNTSHPFFLVFHATLKSTTKLSRAAHGRVMSK